MRRMHPKPASAIKSDELSDMMSMSPGLLKYADGPATVTVLEGAEFGDVNEVVGYVPTIVVV